MDMVAYFKTCNLVLTVITTLRVPFLRLTLFYTWRLKEASEWQRSLQQLPTTITCSLLPSVCISNQPKQTSKLTLFPSFSIWD